MSAASPAFVAMIVSGSAPISKLASTVGRPKRSSSSGAIVARNDKMPENANTKNASEAAAARSSRPAGLGSKAPRRRGISASWPRRRRDPAEYPRRRRGAAATPRNYPRRRRGRETRPWGGSVRISIYARGRRPPLRRQPAARRRRTTPKPSRGREDVVEGRVSGSRKKTPRKSACAATNHSSVPTRNSPEIPLRCSGTRPLHHAAHNAS